MVEEKLGEVEFREWLMCPLQKNNSSYLYNVHCCEILDVSVTMNHDTTVGARHCPTSFKVGGGGHLSLLAGLSPLIPAPLDHTALPASPQ